MAFMTFMISSFSTGLFANDITVSLDFAAPKKAISPYIFGINDRADLNKVSPKSIRLGGNRMTAYNWENNKSNAGSDWKNHTDDYMLSNVRPQLKRQPGAAALNVAQDAKEHNVPYTLLTLQMAGYVANKDGEKGPKNSLDGDDWCKVVNRKNADFLLRPDKNDHFVYTDEFLNYLGNKIGKSDSQSGFKAYALDNEPALWSHTHSLIQKDKISAEDLISKSVDLAKTIKDFDPKADVFGPSLFGYSAYDRLGYDWDLIQSKNFYKYDWFIDYYLEKMAEVEKSQGVRLLDVLDLHYYTEAKGSCGVRTCSHFDNDDCIKARINAVRSLYDANYKEKSWITDTGARHFPLLPKLQASIDKYYPGTKIAFTEYNFGGGTDISGAIAQADFLGVLAEYEVYFASIWAFDKAEYQFAAINIFTDYDGQGSGFGDSLIKSSSSDDYTVSSYVAENSSDGKLHIILTNKEIHNKTRVTIDLGKQSCKAAVNYVLDKSGTKIHQANSKIKIKGNKIVIDLEPLTVNHLVLD
ncbi:MAG: glycoside hydrolase family 44 protein [Treponema sp.]|nr:glycoside hydrolase family 44 protein [Treponema sp.]